MSPFPIAEMQPALSPNGHSSCLDFLAALSQEEREIIFATLLREMVKRRESIGVIPLHSMNGEWLGNLVTPNYPGANADRLFASLNSETRKAIVLDHLDLKFGPNMTEEEITKTIDEAYANSDPRTRQTFFQPYLDLEMPPRIIETMDLPLPRDFDASDSFTIEEFLETAR